MIVVKPNLVGGTAVIALFTGFTLRALRAAEGVHQLFGREVGILLSEDVECGGTVCTICSVRYRKSGGCVITVIDGIGIFQTIALGTGDGINAFTSAAGAGFRASTSTANGQCDGITARNGQLVSINGQRLQCACTVRSIGYGEDAGSVIAIMDGIGIHQCVLFVCFGSRNIDDTPSIFTWLTLRALRALRSTERVHQLFGREVGVLFTEEVECGGTICAVCTVGYGEGAGGRVGIMDDIGIL